MAANVHFYPQVNLFPKSSTRTVESSTNGYIWREEVLNVPNAFSLTSSKGQLQVEKVEAIFPAYILLSYFCRRLRTSTTSS